MSGYAFLDLFLEPVKQVQRGEQAAAFHAAPPMPVPIETAGCVAAQTAPCSILHAARPLHRRR